MSIIKGFTLYILRIPITVFDNKIPVNFLVSLIVIIMLVPLMSIINSYLPFLIGRSSNQRTGNDSLKIINDKGTS